MRKALALSIICSLLISYGPFPAWSAGANFYRGDPVRSKNIALLHVPKLIVESLGLTLTSSDLKTGTPETDLAVALAERSRKLGLSSPMGEDAVSSPKQAQTILAATMKVVRRYVKSPQGLSQLSPSQMMQINSEIWEKLLQEHSLHPVLSELTPATLHPNSLSPSVADHKKTKAAELPKPRPVRQATPSKKFLGVIIAGVVVAWFLLLAPLWHYMFKNPTKDRTVQTEVVETEDYFANHETEIDENEIVEIVNDYVTNKSRDKILAGFVKALPRGFKRNYLLMIDTESQQPASPLSPRIISQSENSRTLVAYNIDGSDAEIIDNKEKSFYFHHLLTDGGQANFEKNAADCAGCHHERPNWDPYDSWALRLPFNRDRIYEGSEEAKALIYLFASLKEHPVFGQLEPPEAVKVIPDGVDKAGKNKYRVEIKYGSTEAERTIEFDGVRIKQGGRYFTWYHNTQRGLRHVGEGEGIALFDQLSELNAQRVARQVEESRNFDRFKFVLRAAINGYINNEKDLEKYLPISILERNNRYFGMSYEKLEEETKQARRSISASKLDLQKRALRELILANAQREGIHYTEKELHEKILGELLRRRPDEDEKLDATGMLVDQEIYGTEDTMISALRYILEPEGILVDTWSLSVKNRAKTYTFADRFGDYIKRLGEILPYEGTYPGVQDELAEASMKAYGAP